MMKQHGHFTRRQRVARRIREKIHGTAERPRLSVYKSNVALYVQAFDDERGHTLFAADSRKLPGSKSCKGAEALGKLVVEKAQKHGIRTFVFDRSGYRYHGRIKALFDTIAQGISTV